MRYYYKDENGNYFSYKEKHNDLIEVTYDEFNNHLMEVDPEYRAYIEAIQAQQNNELDAELEALEENNNEQSKRDD